MYTECQNKYKWIKEAPLSEKSTKKYKEYKEVEITSTVPRIHTLAPDWSNAQSNH